MNAIVLTPGEPLADYVPRPADLTIGINRAALFFACDVWSCGDTPNILRLQEKVIGSPLLIAPRITLDALNDVPGFKWRGEQFASTNMVEYMHTSEVNWPWCSFLIGCLYAAYKGATHIEVFGAGWKGTNDFDGVQAGMNRTEDRWREERALFGALQIQLGVRGVELVRHGND